MEEIEIIREKAMKAVICAECFEELGLEEEADEQRDTADWYDFRVELLKALDLG